MQYNQQFFKDLLTKRGWYKLFEDKDVVFFSRDPRGIDRLTAFFLIFPERQVVVHFGLSSFLIPRPHILAIKGYIKTKYKVDFEHYAEEYQILSDYINGEGTMDLDHMYHYKI